jgi:signal transduction histidine kinase
VAGWQRESTGRGVSLYRSFDLLFFSLFVYFTAGPSSPFFAFFVFSLVVGTVRWQWKGAVWTAVVSLATLLAVGVYFSEVRVDPDFELHTFIIRAFYLAVIAGLLAYLGAHEAHSRREIEALHFDLAAELARTVAMEERVRLARDLHDGVLQSMTVFGLQLAAARRRLPEDPEAVGRSLEELQQLIASEIVRCVAQGLRNRVIGERLHITEGTVKIHLHNIFEKLGLESRLELARFAQRKGIG